MRIRFVDEAGLEFLDAISYYQTQQPELGYCIGVVLTIKFYYSEALAIDLEING